MAHRRLGHADKARAWYDKAVGWIEKNRPRDERLLRFRAEAAELMGVNAAPPDKSERQEAIAEPRRISERSG
jgi:hypothetical protein